MSHPLSTYVLYFYALHRYVTGSSRSDKTRYCIEKTRTVGMGQQK